MFWHNLNHLLPSYTSRKNDAENNVATLEVEGGWGNHVELEEQATAIKHLDEEQQELLHKLLVYIGRGQGCSGTI